MMERVSQTLMNSAPSLSVNVGPGPVILRSNSHRSLFTTINFWLHTHSHITYTYYY